MFSFLKRWCTTLPICVIFLCSGLEVSKAQLADSPWPSFRNDSKNTGLSDYNGPSNSSVKWSFEAGSNVDSSPVIDIDGTIYVGSDDHYLYAINPDGSLKWSYELGDAVNSSPVISGDGTIYVGSEDHYLYAINRDGSLNWSFETGGDVTSQPAIADDGTIYVGSSDDYFYALNPDGSQKWSFLMGANVDSHPAIGSDGTIYIGTWNEHLYAINPDGSLKWTFNTNYSIDENMNPAIGPDETIYIGSGDTLFAINPDGSRKWAFGSLSYIEISPAIGPDTTIYMGSTNDTLYAINPDGSLKWTFSEGVPYGFEYSTPAVGANGVVYIGAYEDSLYAVNPDGSLLWKDWYDSGYEASSPAIGPDGTLYVGTDGDFLHAVEGSNSAPEAFDLVYPTGHEVITTLAPNLQWRSASDPDPDDTVAYTIQMDGPETGIIEIDAERDTSYQIARDLQDNSIYHWRVIAHDLSDSTTINSNGYTLFVVDTDTIQPGAFSLITPTDSSVEVTQNPFFYWTEPSDEDIDDQISYQLFVAEDSTFESAYTATLDTNVYDINEQLGDNNQYFWYVNAEDQKGTTTSSDTLMFWVNTVLEPPLEFEQISPQDGETGLSRNPVLTWEQTKDNDPLDFATYTVIVAEDEELSEGRQTMNANRDTSFAIESELDDDTEYYWSVVATDTDTLQTHSDTLSFVVGTITGIEDSEELPDEYRLYKPFPNPFNPQTTIKYDLPATSHVTIEAYNILGRYIQTLVNGVRSDGTHRVQFESGELPSGQYLIRMQAGGFVAEETVMLVK